MKLTQDGIFCLKQLVCDDRNFGNVIVVLSHFTFDLKFVCDRGDTWCEILMPCKSPEWFFLEDVATALGLPQTNYSSDFHVTMKVVLDFVKKHLNEIEAGFQPENVQLTRQRVQEMVDQRIQRTYGDIPME